MPNADAAETTTTSYLSIADVPLTDHSSDSLKGTALIQQIATNTGLPEEIMTNELGQLITGAGLNVDVVTLDDLRQVLADYVQEILLSAKADIEQETLLPAAGE